LWESEEKKKMKIPHRLRTIRWGILLMALVSISVPEAGYSEWNGTEVVTTTYGDVKGFADNADTWVWKAIPFATPPVGELRWQAPHDPEPWSGIREETEFCNWCPQFSSEFDPSNNTMHLAGNEDCLYLNIWRPQSEEIHLPVYLWIHGGGNSVGSASIYDGSILASTSNLIVITIQYRLGPFGWFTHPALRQGESALDDSGNYGTLDIIKALEWVRDNINAFGGDPNNVTIAGESAGAINVLSLIISPAASSLFHKAIAQSGLLSPVPLSAGDSYANTVIEALLANDGTPEDQAQSVRESMTDAEIEAYLRSKSTEEFLRH